MGTCIGSGFEPMGYKLLTAGSLFRNLKNGKLSASALPRKRPCQLLPGRGLAIVDLDSDGRPDW